MILNINAEASEIIEDAENEVLNVENAKIDSLISDLNEAYETIIIHAHAPYSEENTPRKQRDCKSKLSNASVEGPIRNILEKQKEVKAVKHVIVKELGYRTYRPTTIQIEVLKHDLENFKDMNKFIKKIGLLDFSEN